MSKWKVVGAHSRMGAKTDNSKVFDRTIGNHLGQSQGRCTSFVPRHLVNLVSKQFGISWFHIMAAWNSSFVKLQQWRPKMLKIRAKVFTFVMFVFVTRCHALDVTFGTRYISKHQITGISQGARKRWRGTRGKNRPSWVSYALAGTWTVVVVAGIDLLINNSQKLLD